MFATGARQLVVQEPLDTIVSKGVKVFSLTPNTIVLSTFLAGADISTFLAPCAKCTNASFFELNFPVHSKTTSRPSQSTSLGL